MKKVSPKTEKTQSSKEKTLDSSKLKSKDNNMDQLHPTLQWYQDNKITYTSGSMTQTLNDNKEWKKAFFFDKPPKPNGKKWAKGEWSWKNPEHRQQLPNRTGYALLTGKISGFTVLDFDNTKNIHILEIYEVIKNNCNMVAITRENHEHYYFKYNSEIKTVPSPKNKEGVSLYEFDTRNDGGLIYAEPSYYRDRNDDLNEIHYKFVKKPNTIKDLLEIPKKALDLIKKLDNRYFSDSMFIDDNEEEEEKPKPKPKQEVEKIEVEEEEDNKNNFDKKYVELLNCLTVDRCNNYDEWIQIGMALKNDNKYDEFVNWSKQSPKYDGKSIKIFWDGFNNNNVKQLTIKSIINKAKIDNIDKYNKWLSKYDDFYENLKNMSHADWANLYYEENKYKYIVSKEKEWYEYNPNNILINQKGIPSSLLNDITHTTRLILIEKRNKLLPSTDKEKMAEYNAIQQRISKFYICLGTSSYVKGIIEYLENLYLNLHLDDLIDNNIKVLSFNNCLYDIEKGKFRSIEPNDYITKTTKRDAPVLYKKSTNEYIINKNPEYQTKIDELLKSIFGSNEQINYWLKITSLSLFKNSYESLYLLQGSGGNGKGVLSNILLKVLGDYMFIAPNTFLSERNKGSNANSALAKCKNIRYLLVSEPDDGTNETELNVEFVKMITGSDPISTRDLYKSNFTYIPQFTPFVQCNNIPSLGKLDGGIERRIKLHIFPHKFVSNPDPKKPEEKKINTSLKSDLNKEYLDNFMIRLIEIAQENYSFNEIEQPISNQKETQDYINENNPVKNFMDSYLIKVLPKEKKKLRFQDVYQFYLDKGFKRVNKKTFRSGIEKVFVIEKDGDNMIFDAEIKKTSSFIDE